MADHDSSRSAGFTDDDFDVDVRINVHDPSPNAEPVRAGSLPTCHCTVAPSCGGTCPETCGQTACWCQTM